MGLAEWHPPPPRWERRVVSITDSSGERRVVSIADEDKRRHRRPPSASAFQGRRPRPPLPRVARPLLTAKVRYQNRDGGAWEASGERTTCCELASRAPLELLELFKSTQSTCRLMGDRKGTAQTPAVRQRLPRTTAAPTHPPRAARPAVVLY